MPGFLGDFVRNVPTQLHKMVAVERHTKKTLSHDNTESSPKINSVPAPPIYTLPPSYQPTDWDVCCGRGKRHWNHPGNLRFRQLIQSKLQRYMDTPTRSGKTLVVVSVVEEIRRSGGHFLKQDASNEQWYDIGDAEARDKVGHSLRDQVTAHHQRQQQQSRRQSMTCWMSSSHSESGIDSMECLRTSSLSISIRSSFERRPSFIADSYESYGLSQRQASSLLSGDNYAAASSWRLGCSLRRSSNWEFLESLDDLLNQVMHDDSSNFIENLDRVDHQVSNSMCDDIMPLRLSETVASMMQFSLAASDESPKK
jgi:hypothetical protein